MRKKLLVIFGTRPEAIKLAPLILALKKEPRFRTIICVTAQHRQMLDQVLAFFKITPDIDLDIMKPDQSIEELTANIFAQLTPVLNKVAPDLVIVQGDTTTAFVGALAAFYRKIPIAHVEAGLRTHDPRFPFPEEMNRQLVARMALLHFAPTDTAVKNLAAEGVAKQCIFKTGNTVVDAIGLGRERLRRDKELIRRLEKWFHERIDTDGGIISGKRRLVLITGHRRESFGEGFGRICGAIKELAACFPSDVFVYPVHLNPNVQKPVYAVLSGCYNILLIKPVDYDQMLWLMLHTYLLLTDSGGIQEEAPGFKIPVLVMRDKTERPEGVAWGCCRLVGNDRNRIVAAAKKVLSSDAVYRSMQCDKNPYGDGKASGRIVAILRRRLKVNG